MYYKVHGTQATSSHDSDKWWDSMRKEIADLLKSDTWTVVSRSTLPRGRKPTKSRWVYTIKYHRDGTIERRKSRFVVCGYSQVKGKDFDFSPEASLALGAAVARCSVCVERVGAALSLR